MTNPSWFSHPDLMQVIILLLFSGFIFFAVRALRKIDKNQDCLYNKYNDHETRIAHLEGEHKARVEFGGNQVKC